MLPRNEPGYVPTTLSDGATMINSGFQKQPALNYPWKFYTQEISTQSTAESPGLKVSPTWNSRYTQT